MTPFIFTAAIGGDGDLALTADGGKGGDLSYTGLTIEIGRGIASPATSRLGRLTLVGGSGGTSINVGGAGAGGAGGSVSMFNNGSVTLYNSDNRIAAGIAAPLLPGGAAPNGQGGSATFSAATLAAGSAQATQGGASTLSLGWWNEINTDLASGWVSLTSGLVSSNLTTYVNPGSLSVTIGTLDVQHYDFRLDAKGLHDFRTAIASAALPVSASGNAYIENIRLSFGRTLYMTDGNGAPLSVIDPNMGLFFGNPVTGTAGNFYVFSSIAGADWPGSAVLTAAPGQQHKFGASGTLPASIFHFLIPGSAKNNDILLDVRGGGSAHIQGIGLKLYTPNALSNMGPGDSISLMTNVALDQPQTAGVMEYGTAVTNYGATDYNWTIGTEDKGGTANRSLVARLADMNVDRAHSYGQGFTSTLLTITEGLPQKDFSSQTLEQKEDREIVGTVQAKASSATIFTDCHVELDSQHLLAGGGVRFRGANGSLELIVFGEAGKGQYETHWGYDRQKYEGEGDANYQGGGIRAEYRHASGFYTRASLRGGWADFDYKSQKGNLGSYDLDTHYVGAHLDLGWMVPLWEGGAVEPYGKYMWNRLMGESTTTSYGERLKFEDLDSHKTQVGLRLHHSFSDYFALFAGGAWAEEWAGKAEGSLNGYAYPAPHTEGSAAVVDFGVTVNFTKHIAFELKGESHWGRHEGIGGFGQFTVAW